MNTPPYSLMTLKRPYPFRTDNAQVPHYREQQHDLNHKPTSRPMCLLGSVIDVQAQARREACHLINRTYPVATGRHDLVFEVSPRGDFFELKNNGSAFARLDKAFCSEARQLVGLEVEFQACLQRKCWDGVARASWSHLDENVTFRVDINIKSLRHHADQVGNILLRSGIFLQSPSQNPGCDPYYNPQILQIEGFCEKPDEVMAEAEDVPLSAGLLDRLTESNPKPAFKPQDNVEQILDSLSHTNILQEIRTDTDRIKSTLMGHQMTALDFITQRESSRPSAELTFWREKRRDGETYFQHVLTRSEVSESREARGGILADDMGLGKTLTMLSAIASSLHDAENFASSQTISAKSSSHPLQPSRATLIIVPSTSNSTPPQAAPKRLLTPIALIDNWIDEIRMHTYPHKLTFHKHLSAERHAEQSLLFEKDVVFTTYATAFEDTKKAPSPLAKVQWFRIVLDEAHKIRNRKTKIFKAIHELSAHRRWCLTGTPIQNRLEDLGSLVAFLRMTELAHVSTFRTFVIAPTLSDQAQFKNLQTVLGTICLRRTRQNLGLPEPIPQERLIEFTPSERCQYNDLYEHYKRQVQMAVSGNGKYASTTLQSIHELRLFCNNGLRKTKIENHGSDDEMLSYLLQMEENVCAKCSASIFCIDQVESRDSGMFIQPCKHLVCHSCRPVCVDKKKGKGCSLCASGHSPPDFTTHIESEEIPRAANEAVLSSPSKLRALLNDITCAPRSKCIVFSAWKKTLDLAAELFNQAGLKYNTIHGGLTLKQRLRVLKDFKSPMGPNILFMTLGTGAEGLTLTIASHIYLLEPQWNPFVELQAMARAQRIGQTKQVVCVRYVMQGSIEKSDVLNRQKRKTLLAGGGFKNEKIQDSLQYFGVDPARMQDNFMTYQPSALNDQPSAWNDQPSAWNDQPSAWNDQPSAWNDQPSAWNDQPSAWNDALPGDWML